HEVLERHDAEGGDDPVDAAVARAHQRAPRRDRQERAERRDDRRDDDGRFEVGHAKGERLRGIEPFEGFSAALESGVTPSGEDGSREGLLVSPIFESSLWHATACWATARRLDPCAASPS